MGMKPQSTLYTLTGKSNIMQDFTEGSKSQASKSITNMHREIFSEKRRTEEIL